MQVDLSKIYLYQFDKSIPIEQVLQELSDDPNIEYAEPNYIFSTQLVPNDQYYLDHYPDNIGNRDPNWNPPYDYQWNLKNINADNAWSETTGTTDITVAIIDTGVDCTHDELVGQCSSGYDFINNDADPVDDHGHGTHVAGIIGSLSNNSEGIAGIDWHVNILPIKGLDTIGIGTNDSLSNSIVYASNQGANVINMSWAAITSRMPLSLKDAVDYAYSMGVVLVAAAGNSNDDVANGYWPANYQSVISVSATDEKNEIASYSNYGKIDIAAPGGNASYNIISLNAHDPNNPSSYMNLGGSPISNKYLRLSGTSMAAPHVSALAALILSKNPTWSNEEISSLIEYTAKDLGELGKDNEFGYGIIDAGYALSLDRPPPFAEITSPKQNYLVDEKIEIKGEAYGRDFDFFQIQISQNDSDWIDTGITLIDNGNNEVNGGILGYFDPTGYSKGERKIKLSVFGKTNTRKDYITNIDIVDKYTNPGLAGFCNNSNSYSIQYPDFLTIKDNEDFTIEAWIKPDFSASSQQFFLARSNNTGGSQLRITITSPNQDDGSLGKIVFSTGKTGFIIVDNAIPFNKWSHIGALKVGNKIKLFINGVLEGENNYASAEPNEDGNLYLCSWVVNNKDIFYPFTGAFDELRISNIARDIEGNWNSGIYQNSLEDDQYTMAHFGFNQNNLDSSGNQHHINDAIKYIDSVIRDDTDFGEALYLDPVSADHQPAYIAIPENTNLNLDWPLFTIEGWIRPDDEVINGVNRSNPSYILAKEAVANPNGGSSFPYSIAIADGHLEFKIKLHGYPPDQMITRYLQSETVLAADQWYYFKAIVNNQSIGDNTISLYINDNLEAYENFPDGYNNTDSGMLTIGCAKVSNFPLCLSNYFGAIDDLRISNFDRSNFPMNINPFPVDDFTVGLWKFDSNTLDSGPRSLNGEVHGNIEFTNIRYMASNLPTKPTTAPDPCLNFSLGDFTCDGTINSVDYTYWLSEYRCINADEPNCTNGADFDSNGVVNLFDFTILISGIKYSSSN